MVPKNVSEVPAGRRRSAGRISLGLLVSAVVIYGVVVSLFGILQRSLVFVPTRAARLVPSEWLAAPERARPVQLTTHDGLSLNGWYFAADGRVSTDDEFRRVLAAGRPLVLYFCGNGGHRGHRADDYEVLHAAGADVLVFDYRGFGDNPGQPTEADLARDAQEAWNFALALPGVTRERVVVFGESLGGGVAVRLSAWACEQETPPAGVILRSTFTSLVAAGEHLYPFLPVSLLLIDRFDSLSRIANVNCPLLSLHGTQDEIVPFAMGRALFEAAPDVSASGVRKRFVELSAVGHNDYLPAARQEMLSAVRDLFNALGVHSADPPPEGSS